MTALPRIAPALRRGGAALLLAAAGAAQAAAPVEEAGSLRSADSANSAQQAAAADAAPAENPDADHAGISRLYYQMQLLEDEVRRLQGLVEEQDHRIERLVREQRERYVELDQRLLALLRGDESTQPDQSMPTGSPMPAGGRMTPTTPANPASAVPLSAEDSAYERAHRIVTEAQELVPSEQRSEQARAVTLFRALIADYPGGARTPDAYYWIGELELAGGNLEPARQAFAQVVNLYGDHAKAPEALYKLGVTYQRLGDTRRSLLYLDRVIAEHPDDAVARLARAYAAELR